MRPSKDAFCKFLANTGFELSCIIDVGVGFETRELRTNFKTVKQILVEPQKLYNGHIDHIYKDNIYEIKNIGMDKAPGNFFLHSSYGVDGDRMGSLPSHNSVSEKSSDVTVEVNTLNNIAESLNEWILLKIDVDGKDADVLRGAEECLKKCAFVIIEAHTSRFAEISDILCNNNFKLFGIVDLCYLDNALWQCDLIFVNNDVRHLHEAFDPMLHWKSKESIFRHKYYQVHIS